MSQGNTETDRLQQLLADEAAYGPDAAIDAEIQALMGAGAGLHRDDFMKVAGLMQIGFLKQDQRSARRMPDDLREKLAQQARDFFDQRPAQSDSSPSVTDIRTARKAPKQSAEPTRRPGWLNADRAGWLVAAALALTFLVVRPDQGPGVEVGNLPAQRVALLGAPDAIVADWASGVAADGYENVSGDVVWSDREQTGYLRLSGLTANNARQAQYQLWIVDPTRDENPVDGGVFDVPAGVREVIVPINSKLAVTSPAAFAITLEQPGGVVVSDGPLLVVAPVTG